MVEIMNVGDDHEEENRFKSSIIFKERSHRFYPNFYCLQRASELDRCLTVNYT